MDGWGGLRSGWGLFGWSKGLGFFRRGLCGVRGRF